MLNLLRMRWLFNRYVGWSILWIAILASVAGIMNVIGIQLAGDIAGWSAWLKDHAPVFLIWRICLYGGVGYGWLWMRNRVIARDIGTDAKQRFVRIEIGAVTALLLLEITNWMG